MARVTGIGGFFFRARDPNALAAWYEEHLGVLAPTGNYEEPNAASVARDPERGRR